MITQQKANQEYKYQNFYDYATIIHMFIQLYQAKIMPQQTAIKLDQQPPGQSKLLHKNVVPNA